MISLIAAISNNNVIGKDNKLLWHIPEDLKHFKEITLNSKIIMGRKTFESLPGMLPKRHHIILTRNKDYMISSDKVTIISDFKDIINNFKDSEEEVFIIGGEQIYNLFIDYCEKLYLTRVNASYDGDAFFPKFNLDNFMMLEESPNFNSSNNLSYKYITLKRKA